jgi:hypothetical protein
VQYWYRMTVLSDLDSERMSGPSELPGRLDSEIYLAAVIARFLDHVTSVLYARI